jgi:hypothetical protein
MAFLLMADHLALNPKELLKLAGWPPLRVFEIQTESTEALLPEAVDWPGISPESTVQHCAGRWLM